MPFPHRETDWHRGSPAHAGSSPAADAARAASLAAKNRHRRQRGDGPVGIATTRLAVLAARNGPTGLLRDGRGFAEGGISERPAMPFSVVDPLRLLRALTAVATTAGPSMDPGLPLRIRLLPVLVHPVRHLARVPSLGSIAARPPNDHRPERHGHRPEQRIRPEGRARRPPPSRTPPRDTESELEAAQLISEPTHTPPAPARNA